MDERLKRAEELEEEAERLRQDAKVNPPKVERITYLIETAPGEYSVGCRDEPQVGDYPYNGPCARVEASMDWLFICTDNYEGNAMLNIEALPKLIEALQRLETHLKSPDIKKGERADG